MMNLTAKLVNQLFYSYTKLKPKKDLTLEIRLEIVTLWLVLFLFFLDFAAMNFFFFELFLVVFVSSEETRQGGRGRGDGR